MPRIIVQASESGGDAVRVTLSERVVASHLQDGHYAEQLLERLVWAAIDANHGADGASTARHGRQGRTSTP